MSLNSLKIATGGYLKRNTKAVLIIAVAGYLNFQGTPPIPPTPPPTPSGGGGYAPSRSRYTWEQQEEENERERIKNNNEFIIEFLKTATNIINNQ